MGCQVVMVIKECKVTQAQKERRLIVYSCYNIIHNVYTCRALLETWGLKE